MHRRSQFRALLLAALCTAVLGAAPLLSNAVSDPLEQYANQGVERLSAYLQIKPPSGSVGKPLGEVLED